MRLADYLRALLELPELRGLTTDLDAPKTTVIHGEIIRRKNFLRRLYREWYDILLLHVLSAPANGALLEIGSGAGFIKDVIPHAITTDVLAVPMIDCVASAEQLPFQEESVSAILGINVFHHLSTPASFLKEARRCLMRNGKIVLIEPANSSWGKFIFQHFHHEPFAAGAEWGFESTGRLSAANIALPWIVFERDRSKFQEMFPDLSVELIQYHTPLRYLLSGGVSMRSLVPDWSFSFFRILELLFAPLSRHLGMFQTIVIYKRDEGNLR